MNPDFEIDYNRLEFISKISESPSCKVELARLKEVDGTKSKEVAAKTYISFKITEINILSQLKHRNVITFIGAVTKDRNILVMEYAPNENLYDYLRKQNHRMSFDHSLEWAKHCSSAVAYLHSKTIIHRDIKSPNFLLSTDFTEPGSIHILKLCDFGISHKSKTTATSTLCTVGGMTYRWAAPEVLRKSDSCSVRSDVYSLAVVIWELFTGEIPYYGCDDVQIMFNITGNPPVTLDTDRIRSQFICTMLKKCWSKEKSDRPVADAVIETLDEATDGTVTVSSDETDAPSHEGGSFPVSQPYEFQADRFPVIRVKEQELNILAGSMGAEWKSFVRDLGLTDADVHQASANGNTERDKIFNCLIKWRSHESTNATVRALAQKCYENQIDIDAYNFLSE